MSLPSLNCCNAKIATNNSEKEIKKSKILVLPRENFNDEELDHKDSDNCRPKDNSFQKIGFDIKKGASILWQQQKRCQCLPEESKQR